MTIDEKISHIVDRLIKYEQSNFCDKFKDVDALDDIEYSCLFFGILAALTYKNMMVGRRIIGTNKKIGLNFIEKGRDKTHEYNDWFEKFLSDHFKELIENNKDFIAYVGEK